MRLLTTAPFLKNLTKLELNDPHLADTDRSFSELVQALNPDTIQKLQWGSEVFGSGSLLFNLARSNTMKSDGQTP